MIITSDLNPTGGFTQILNSVIFDDRLSHAEFRVWCRLLALRKGARQITVEVNAVAKELGMSADLLRVHRRSLKEKGFLIASRDKLVVTIPEEGFKPKEVKLTPEQQLRHDLKETWNASKPEKYPKLRNPVSEAQVETIKLHAQHNEAKDLCQFLRLVLEGCRADSWWKDKRLGIDNVFGKGRPKQNKFTNVEKLYSLAGSAKGRAAIWEFDNDQDWINWFVSKGHDMKHVVRLQMEQDDAWIHQVEHEGDETIYIYSEDQRVVHWTYKEGQHGVSYLPTAK